VYPKKFKISFEASWFYPSKSLLKISSLPYFRGETHPRNFAKNPEFTLVKRPPPNVKRITQTLFTRIADIPSVIIQPSIIPNALPTNATSVRSSHQLQNVPNVNTWRPKNQIVKVVQSKGYIKKVKIEAISLAKK